MKTKGVSMSDKKHAQYPSRYEVGEEVVFVLLGKDKKEQYKAPAYIRAVMFTNEKVRYSVYLKYMKTTIHNVDSVFIQDAENSGSVDFGFDNYS